MGDVGTGICGKESARGTVWMETTCAQTEKTSPEVATGPKAYNTEHFCHQGKQGKGEETLTRERHHGGVIVGTIELNSLVLSKNIPQRLLKSILGDGEVLKKLCKERGAKLTSKLDKRRID